MSFSRPHRLRMDSGRLLKFFSLLIYGFLFCLAAQIGAWAAEPVSKSIAVIVSRQIRPFIEVSQGVLDEVDKIPGVAADTYDLDRVRQTSGEDVPGKWLDKDYSVFLAIGPEAAQYLWKTPLPLDAVRIYAAVLNPEKNIKGLDSAHCGVSLNIPVQEQVRMIRTGLPGVERIGMIYDPRYNEAFYEAARQAAASMGMRIAPLRVNDRKSIPEVLESSLDAIDCLWMIPDATVISETIIHYVIKTCLLNEKSVIGYNRFFYESGAGLSFVFDYYRLGRQAGQMAAAVLREKACERRAPDFEVWLNRRIYEQLELELPEHPPARIKVRK